MRAQRTLLVLAVLLTSAHGLTGQQTGQPPAAPPRPAFRSGVNLVLVDVVVRDRSGAFVKGLTANDFELREDGVRQQIVSFAYDEVRADAPPIERLSALAARGATQTPASVSTPGTTVEPMPLTSDETAGHRLIALLFDTSSMQPEDVQNAIDGAAAWVRDRMTTADLVAVAAIGSSLRVLTDFTTSRERVQAALASLSASSGTAFDTVDASTAATDDAAQSATEEAASADQSAQELDTFNNDVRLRAIQTLAQALQPIQQKKAILYFSSGMQRSGTDNQVALRAAVNATIRANASIYPVDARGLQAIVPGGSARQGSRGGLAAFSGSGVAGQFAQFAAQQDTLTSLASDTGGTAFIDTNDFGEAFRRVERDVSAYYILGFSSTNTARDGRFRRITVRVRDRGSVKVEAKDGYYADRDFAHTAKGDREALLQEQLATPIPATDLPLFVTTGWFRLTADKYYVPISLMVPGAVVPLDARAKGTAALDVAGFIRDERGLPIGRIRDTLKVPPGADTNEARPILYGTNITLPPGRFTVKIVVRENADGRMGTFETLVTVPDLKSVPLKLSSVVLSTQLRSLNTRKSPNPLVRDGVEIVPNLTHILSRDQKLYVYYEVYDPRTDNGAAQLRTSLAFYRGKVKMFETPETVRTEVDAADRHAAVFQFELPGGSFTPGLYTCQVNVIDEAAGSFAFPRVQMYVR
jgi:VWFA-related protein